LSLFYCHLKAASRRAVSASYKKRIGFKHFAASLATATSVPKANQAKPQ
jgi:hypothetical protein